MWFSHPLTRLTFCNVVEKVHKSFLPFSSQMFNRSFSLGCFAKQFMSFKCMMNIIIMRVRKSRRKAERLKQRNLILLLCFRVYAVWHFFVGINVSYVSYRKICFWCIRRSLRVQFDADRALQKWFMYIQRFGCYLSFKL